MGVSMVDTMLKFVVVSLLIAGVFGGDEGKEKVVKVKNTYPATHNILGNLYNTKHGHAIHEYYGLGSDHGYDHGVHRPHYGYGPSFNKGRVMAYSHGDLIYPNKLYGYIVQGDRNRYYRYPWQRDVDYHYARGLGYTKDYGHEVAKGYGRAVPHIADNYDYAENLYGYPRHLSKNVWYGY